MPIFVLLSCSLLSCSAKLALMCPTTSSWRAIGLRVCLALLVLLPFCALHAQQLVWNDTWNGGLVVDNFSRGTGAQGLGYLEVPVPDDATIRKATFYAIELNGTDASTTVVALNGVEYTFDSGSTLTPLGFTSYYGPVRLHALELTAVFDPLVDGYLIEYAVPPGDHIGFTEVFMAVAYEEAGAGEVTADFFWCDQNSASEENYTVTTSAPMRTDHPIAFGTMASYCQIGLADCEEVRVNGNYLGYLGGPDENAASLFGASASFHYRLDDFVGLGTDDADVPILMADALTDLSALVANNATTFNVVYNHCGNPISPWDQDNLVNMMLVAYASDICALPLDLGPDTVLCAGETLELNATRPGATYSWNDGVTTAVRTVDQPGTYVVTLTHPQCTWAADTIVVDFAPALAVDLGPDQVLCTGQEVSLAVPIVAGASYAWADGNTDNPRVVVEPGTYALTASFGRCAATDSITIAVDECPFNVALPNIFTPNGDASNRVFAPLHMDGVQRLSITVYNRWGQSLFTSTALNFQWDGRSAAGLSVPDGTYFWVLTYVPLRGDGTEQAMTGTVTITR